MNSCCKSGDNDKAWIYKSVALGGCCFPLQIAICLIGSRILKLPADQRLLFLRTWVSLDLIEARDESTLKIIDWFGN